MPELARPAAGSRLGRLIRTAGAREAAREGSACELCGVAIPEQHRHLLELDEGRVRCVCRACSLLFDRSGAGGERHRLIPDRVRRVAGFRLDDARWQDLAVPVGLAYFFHSSRERRVAAFYPGPMGATESRLGLEAWEALEVDNPVLRGLEPDVEALLVMRAGAAREHWLVPIDACFRLVAVLRTHWQGLSGGSDAWRAVGAYFEELGRRARRVDRHGRPARVTARTEA